jgi:hypothetical protein
MLSFAVTWVLVLRVNVSGKTCKTETNGTLPFVLCAGTCVDRYVNGWCVLVCVPTVVVPYH